MICEGVGGSGSGGGCNQQWCGFVICSQTRRGGERKNNEIINI